MIQPSDKLAIYMEGAVGKSHGKMGDGVLRYSRQSIVAVVDSETQGGSLRTHLSPNPEVPIVGSLVQAKAAGANVLILGIAPVGGQIPEEWRGMLREAVAMGFSLVNGLHDQIGPDFAGQLAEGQWIWDIRQEPEGLGKMPADGSAAHLPGKRVLFIGTDMAVGKMTAGLEIYAGAVKRGIKTAFIATGQIGITVTGRGIPLDAIRVDFACAAMQREMMNVAESELILVEGQGSLCHPGSSANLPLLRGSMPSHLILCCRAGQTHLQKMPSVKIPNLKEYAELYETLGSASGTFPKPKTVAVAVNTAHLNDAEAEAAVKMISFEVGLPAADPVRHGPDTFLEALR